MSQPEPHLEEVPFPILEEFEDAGPLVGILIGSESDREHMEPAAEELNERGSRTSCGCSPRTGSPWCREYHRRRRSKACA